MTAMRPHYASFMSGPDRGAWKRILAIDVGATAIKFCHVDEEGTLLDPVRRRPTPSPCSPDQLVEVLAARIARSSCALVGVGFPGEVVDGRVIDPGNLARGAVTDPVIDRGLHEQWLGFALQSRLCRETGRDVRVANDAELAALGTCTGQGTELVLTLGTGLGIALQCDGVMRRVRDVGDLEFSPGRTYDQACGEGSRAQDEVAWRASVVVAVSGFAREFRADTVYLAGGNARRLSPSFFGDLGIPVLIRGNEAALCGAAKLFYE
jgi:polyphosphate glucokinase